MLQVWEAMMKAARQQPTLHRPATYEIKVPGHIGERGSDWAGGMTITVECEGDGPPVTTLTGTVDQAALLGLLRRLYSLGLPLISVVCVDAAPEGPPGAGQRMIR
jgi:hypothetical protein